MKGIFLPVMLAEIPSMMSRDVFKNEPYIIIKSGVDPVKVAIPNLTGAFGAVAIISTAIASSIYFLGKLIEKIGSATGTQEVDLTPLGIGLKIRLELGKLLQPIGDLLGKLGDELGRGMALSGTLAFMEPLRYLWRYVWWLTFYSNGNGQHAL